MKKFLIVLSLLIIELSNAQTSTTILPIINVGSSVSNPSILMSVNPTTGASANQWKPLLKSAIMWDITNINNFNSSVTNIGDVNYKGIGWLPYWTDILGIPTTLSGYGITDAYPLSSNPSGFISFVPAQTFTSLLSKPTTLSGYGITDAYSSSNPSGYISSFTETDPIWTAIASTYRTITQNDLLYYPLAGNPSNFLTSINSSMINTALGYTSLSTTGNGSGLTGIVNTQISGLGTASTQNTTSFATNAQGTKADSALQVEVDGSTTNELQALSISGQNLTLSNGGGTVTIPDNVYTAGTGIGVSSNIVTNTAPDQTVSLSGSNGLSTSGTYPTFTITQYIPTINSGVTRPINSTTFTPSTTKQSFLSYNITISCTATIGSASTGSVALQYSTNGGSTWTTVGTVSNSNTVSLAVILNSVQASGVQLSGFVPANSLCRMVSTTSGTTVLTYISGQETY